jgi:hypothetical protein
MIRNLCFGLVGAVALASTANAADMYRVPEGGGLKDAPYVPNSWTGLLCRRQWRSRIERN